MSDSPGKVTEDNRTLAVAFINKLRPLDLASASILVLDDDGNTWRVEFTRL